MTEEEIKMIARAIVLTDPNRMVREHLCYQKKYQKAEAESQLMQQHFEEYRRKVQEQIGDEVERRLYDKANEEYSLED